MRLKYLIVIRVSQYILYSYSTTVIPRYNILLFWNDYSDLPHTFAHSHFEYRLMSFAPYFLVLRTSNMKKVRLDEFQKSTWKEELAHEVKISKAAFSSFGPHFPTRHLFIPNYLAGHKIRCRWIRKNWTKLRKTISKLWCFSTESQGMN